MRCGKVPACFGGCYVERLTGIGTSFAFIIIKPPTLSGKIEKSDSHMRKKHFYYLSEIILICSIVSARGSEDYSQWSCYRDITINTTSPGFDLDAEVLNFPLLIRFTQADSLVFNTALANGADLRFSKIASGAAGPPVPYQIETWDKTNRQATLWALVDTVKKNYALPLIRMYWGKNDAHDESDGSRVFDTNAARGFKAVWHLNEETGDTIRDATFNKYKGKPLDTLNAGLPAKTAGIIGLGKHFSGMNKNSGAYYQILRSASGGLNFDTADAYSLSAWVFIDTFDESRYFISKCQYNLLAASDGNLTFSEIRGGSLNNRVYVRNQDSAVGGKKHQWRHIVGVHKPGEKASMQLYVDGMFAGDTALSLTADARTTGTDVMLGRRPDKNTGWFAGSMDEVRIEHRVLSPDWIKLCFRTQKDDSSVVKGPITVRASADSSAGCTLHVVAAIFSVKPASGNDTLTVSFFDSSTGSCALFPLARKWSFGDGDSSSEISPRHFFSKPDSYTVKLTVSAANVTDSMKTSITVHKLALKSDFKADTVIAGGPLKVTFGDFSQGTIYTRQWIFGDGDTLADTNNRGPVVHTFTKTGFSTVKLIIKGPAGSDTMTRNDYVSIGALMPDFFTSVSFDSSANGVTVHWTVDTSIAIAERDSMEAGISWSVTGYIKGDIMQPDTIVKNAALTDSCLLRMGDLLFDTTYYFTTWFRKRGGSWLPLSGNSKAALRTPTFSLQSITYGADHPIAYADNNRFRITVNPAVFSLAENNTTIKLWRPPCAPQGFILMSKGYEFCDKYQSPPLSIGFKYDPTRQGDLIRKIKIYRSINNRWFLERSPQWIDSIEGYVGVTTGDIVSPFIAMIDTSPPVIAIQSHPEKAVVSEGQVIDDFIVSDNIANASWNFRYAKGGYAFDNDHCDTGIFSSCNNRKSTFIPGSYVSADQGVRAILSISDGVSDVVVNVSRRVIREAGVEAFSTEALKWKPLLVTADLDSPGVRNALQGLAGGKAWAYDNTRFRLFRWFPSHGNAPNSADNYVEYSDGLDSVFSLTPGRLLWLKTKKAVVIDFGKGVTTDLTKPFAVPLRARSWNDIGLPFNFDITVGDVLDATIAAGQSIDSLRFCIWSTDANKNYILDEMYFPSLAIEALQDKAITFMSRNSDGGRVGYSVYNASGADRALVIPPLPGVMSGYCPQAGKKKSGEGIGAIVIKAQTAGGSASNRVFCGLSGGKRDKRYFPAAPSLEDAFNIRVCDEQMKQFGHLAATGPWGKDDGASWHIAVNNRSDRAQRIRLSASWITGISREVQFTLFDPSTQTFSDDARDTAQSMRIDVGSGETGYCRLIVGGKGFLAQMKRDLVSLKTALMGMYVSPSGHWVRIRFSLSADAVNIIKLALFDAAGREVWTLTTRGHEGVNDFIWPGKNKSGHSSSSGFFIVHMTVFDSKGDKKGQFEKKLTYLP
jgi:PKD repeat protein